MINDYTMYPRTLKMHWFYNVCVCVHMHMHTREREKISFGEKTPLPPNFEIPDNLPS